MSKLIPYLKERGTIGMKKKILAFIMTFAMVFSVAISGNMAVVNAATSDSTNDWNVERYGDVMDIGTSMRSVEADENFIEDQDAALVEQAKGINFDEDPAEAALAGDSTFSYDGGTKWFLGYNSVTGKYYTKTYTLRSVGEKAEVWVANDLSWPLGDTRPLPVITQEQVDKVRDTFDNVIYEKDTEFFGTPDSHYGSDATLPGLLGLPQNYYEPNDGIERTMILVDNVRDDMYFNPSYPFFIAGFFSPSFERYIDRNIISLDTNNWATRLDNTFLPTIAHEYQHLIHSDNDPAEESWINEGMADYAEYLCGFGQPWGHINFFLDHPENSLVNWDEHVNAPTGPETLADYGQAYLLQLYLDEQFGSEFIRTLATDTAQGISSVNDVLEQFDTGIDFSELFRRFTLALAIDNPYVDGGIYNFKTIDIKVDFQSALAFDKDGVPAWGADYKVLENPATIHDIKFDGIDFLPAPWKVVPDPKAPSKMVLWSNGGDEADNHLIFEADLSNVLAANLKFEHFYAIEKQWDYGFVQVSTDNGQTWESLKNTHTSDVLDPDGYPAIRENLPGFTGTNGAWTKECFNLKDYVGQKVLISFRYMTDWGTTEAGWYVRNIAIPEINLKKAGNSMDGFYSIDEILGNQVQYAVSFVNEKVVSRSGSLGYKVLNIDPFAVSEEDAISLQNFLSSGNNYMIIWYAADEGNRTPVDYSYEIRTNRQFIKDQLGNNPGPGRR